MNDAVLRQLVAARSVPALKLKVSGWSMLATLRASSAIDNAFAAQEEARRAIAQPLASRMTGFNAHLTAGKGLFCQLKRTFPSHSGAATGGGSQAERRHDAVKADAMPPASEVKLFGLTCAIRPVGEIITVIVSACPNTGSDGAVNVTALTADRAAWRE